MLKQGLRIKWYNNTDGKISSEWNLQGEYTW